MYPRRGTVSTMSTPREHICHQNLFSSFAFVCRKHMTRLNRSPRKAPTATAHFYSYFAHDQRWFPSMQSKVWALLTVWRTTRHRDIWQNKSRNKYDDDNDIDLSIVYWGGEWGLGLGSSNGTCHVILVPCLRGVGGGGGGHVVISGCYDESLTIATDPLHILSPLY